MRKVALLLLTLVMLLPMNAALAQDANPNAQESAYIVQPGDTINRIATLFGVDADAILIRNGIIDPNRISVGQTLVIPRGALIAPQSHIIGAGETLQDIAIRYNTTADALLQNNFIPNPNALVPGQVLSLPATGGPTQTEVPTTDGAQTYIVDVGDTLRSIAAEFGTTVDALVAANNIANPNVIQAGTTITIPAMTTATVTNPPVSAPATTTTTGTPTTTAASNPTTYVVQPGDTLESVATTFNVTTESLGSLNGVDNNSQVFPGLVLFIPPTGGPQQQTTVPTATPVPATTTTNAATTTTTTAPVTAQAVVIVPRQTVNGYYTVQAGDNLFAIAADFGVNIYAIAEANGLLNLNHIFIGQALRIPGR